MDLLTPSVNVPAERARLRELRHEIAADVAHREAIQRKYTPRGFLRLDYVPDVHELEAKGQPTHGQAPHGAVRAGAGLAVPSAAADVRKTQAGCACCRCCARGMGSQGGVK